MLWRPAFLFNIIMQNEKQLNCVAQEENICLIYSFLCLSSIYWFIFDLKMKMKVFSVLFFSVVWWSVEVIFFRWFDLLGFLLNSIKFKTANQSSCGIVYDWVIVKFYCDIWCNIHFHLKVAASAAWFTRWLLHLDFINKSRLNENRLWQMQRFLQVHFSIIKYSYLF